MNSICLFSIIFFANYIQCAPEPQAENAVQLQTKANCSLSDIIIKGNENSSTNSTLIKQKRGATEDSNDMLKINNQIDQQFFIVNWVGTISNFTEEMNDMLKVNKRTECKNQIFIGNLVTYGSLSNESVKRIKEDLLMKGNFDQVLMYNWGTDTKDDERLFV